MKTKHTDLITQTAAEGEWLQMWNLPKDGVKWNPPPTYILDWEGLLLIEI